MFFLFKYTLFISVLFCTVSLITNLVVFFSGLKFVWKTFFYILRFSTYWRWSKFSMELLKTGFPEEEKNLFDAIKKSKMPKQQKDSNKTTHFTITLRNLFFLFKFLFWCAPFAGNATSIIIFVIVIAGIAHIHPVHEFLSVLVRLIKIWITLIWMNQCFCIKTNYKRLFFNL